MSLSTCPSVSTPYHNTLSHDLIIDDKRLCVPDTLGILIYASVTAEESHTGNRGNRLLDPFLLVLVRLIHKLVSLVVAVEVIRHQVVIAVVTDCCNQSTKVMDRTEGALLNLDEHFLQIRVDLVRTVLVVVSEILDVLGEVTEQEDVALANLTSDFDLFLVSKKLIQRNPVLLTLAPSQVPMMRPPFKTNFMLLVPDALSFMLATCSSKCRC